MSCIIINLFKASNHFWIFTKDKIMKNPALSILILCFSLSYFANAQDFNKPSPNTDYQIGLDYYQQDDYIAALPFLQSAADNNNADAQYTLGIMYLLGQGVTQDNIKAQTLFQQSAEQGHLDGQYNLALLLAQHKHIKEAIGWFEKAATQGSADAQHNLGVIYYKGLGVTADYQQAFKWYQLAAAQNNPYSLVALADLYRTGTGTTQNFVQAFNLYKRAAISGYPVALSTLSGAYFYGLGTKADPVKAYALACYAALYDEPEASFAENKQFVGQNLSEQQKQQANTLFEELQHNLNIIDQW